ncbi:50S ribosomal protein L24 [Candidatus Curtissbacteria bacterium RBG_13_40_7]|uniref:Large ribosomal subunit protein uL24 n=1 Tax=Candidatus Curtissbacteria bacterium RBG_13_40_7 TaxID=1797706 RepID=A0A1F5FX67_9BACT|nr:MAG: 50S ribosomal protein L24 [Candidatus Curtissbacteria bacterium RBG_13_40_7]
MFKFKVGDQVLITAGRDKGKKGKVEKVLPKFDKLIVDSVNIYKRHKKVARNQAAGIYEIARPIPVAKVAIICPKCSTKTRVGFLLEGANKVRICKKCQGRLTVQK